MLFSATVRYNLDPFNQYDDEQLWNALEAVSGVNGQRPGLLRLTATESSLWNLIQIRGNSNSFYHGRR